MSIFFLLFIIFFVFVVVPLIRGVAAIYRARHAAREFFDQFRQSTSGTYTRPPKQEERKTKKKINPDDGEFVQFEDLPSDRDETATTYTEVTVEQQVVDVEWEDITTTK